MANKSVLLHVDFKITDLGDTPLEGIPVRIVFGSDPRWQEPGSGHRFVTDARGHARFTAEATLDARKRKKPGGFVERLARAEVTDHLMAATKLAFLNYRWLYALELFRFPDGTVMLDHGDVYTRDATGRFTRKGERVGMDWKIADLNGLRLTGPGLPGYDTAEFHLDKSPQDASGRHWTLRLAFKRQPPPVRRD